MRRPTISELSFAAWHHLLLPASIAGSLLGIAALSLFAIGGEGAADAFRALDALAGIAAAVALIALQAAFGCRILAALRWEPLLPHWVERALFGWAIGFVASTGAAMCAAAAGLLNRGSVAVGGAGLAIAGAPVIASAARAVLTSQARAWRGFDSRMLGALAAAAAATGVAILWLWPLLIQTLLPNSDWDSALYHLPLAERYLQGELWNYDPLFSAYSFPGAVSLLYAAFLSLGLESAIVPLNFAVAAMTGVASASLAARVGGRRAAVWAGAIFCTTHIFWQLAVDPRIDMFLCLLVLLAIYAFSLWMLTGRRHELLYLVALTLSGALGCKYSALLYAAGIGGAALWAMVWQSRSLPLRTRVARLATLALLFALPHGAWYAANLVIHRDPVFAMLRGDYALGPDGTPRYLAPALQTQLAQVRSDPKIGPLYQQMNAVSNQTAKASLFDLPDLLLRPARYSPKPNHFASPLLLGFLALPVLLVATRREAAPAGGQQRRRLLWLYCAWGIGFYCAVATQIPVLRYQLPIFPLLAIGTALVLARLGSAWQLVFAAFALALLFFNGRAEAHKLERLEAAAYLSGEMSRLEWLSQVGYNGEPSMPQLIEFVNQRIDSGAMQADDLILMIGEGKGHLLGCDYQPDASWSFQRWLGELLNADFDHAELSRRLREQGVTHILYNRGYYDWVLANTDTPRDRLALGVSHLRRFLREYGSEIYQTRRMRLVQL